MEDIIIKNEFDSSRNQRIYVVHGNDCYTRRDGSYKPDEDGQVDIISSSDYETDIRHVAYLSKYIDQHYSLDCDLMRYNSRKSEFYNPDLLVFMNLYLVENHNNILLMNQGSLNSKKLEFASISLPNEISATQYNAFFDLLDQIGLDACENLFVYVDVNFDNPYGYTIVLKDNFASELEKLMKQRLKLKSNNQKIKKI